MRWMGLMLVGGIALGCKAGPGQDCAKPEDCARGLTCTDDDGTCESRDTIEQHARDESERQRLRSEEAAKHQKQRIELEATKERIRREREVAKLEKMLADREGDTDEIKKLRAQLDKLQREGAGGRSTAPSCDPADPLCDTLE